MVTYFFEKESVYMKQNTIGAKNLGNFYQYKGAVARRCSVKEGFIKSFAGNSPENTFAAG